MRGWTVSQGLGYDDRGRRVWKKRAARALGIGSGLLLLVGLLLALAPQPLAALLHLWPQDALSYTEPGGTPSQTRPNFIQPPTPTAGAATRPSPTPPPSRDLNEIGSVPTPNVYPSLTPPPTLTQRVQSTRRVQPTELISPTWALTSTVQPPTETSPWRLWIPAIDLTAPVIGAALTTEASGDDSVFTWMVPDFAAVGWHVTSSPPGEAGNTVLNGHNNIQGEVFRYLDDARPGDRVILEADGRSHQYIITGRHIVREAGASLETRIANAGWVAPTDDERLTLVTCWPPTGNSHRLIVIARPVTPADTFTNSYPGIR